MQKKKGKSLSINPKWLSLCLILCDIFPHPEQFVDSLGIDPMVDLFSQSQYYNIWMTSWPKAIWRIKWKRCSSVIYLNYLEHNE
jgi:hypothetical protein